MRFRAFKYISPLTFYITAWLAFRGHGIVCFLPVIYSYVLVPVLELFYLPNHQAQTDAGLEISRNDKTYDYLLYAFVFIQLATVFIFLRSFQHAQLTFADIFGRVASMGLLCGIFGINIGHELGHRVTKSERFLSKLALMTSLYMHFFTEHNKGHHKHVGTAADPASARRGESLYLFWPRTIVMSYISAWKIANRDMRKQNRPVISLHNEMIQAHIIQAAFVGLIAVLFGWQITLYFCIAALQGILLLETVNYIEHYGLSRRQITAGKYERVMPHHSWNSNHVFGRIMLFELSRHSDHHYMASRKYQLLRHYADAPQMPTGYPGMMLLALAPPVWFFVMHRRIDAYHNMVAGEPVGERPMPDGVSTAL